MQFSQWSSDKEKSRIIVVVAYLFKASISEPYFGRCGTFSAYRECCDEKMNPPIDLFSKVGVDNHLCAK